MQVGIGISACGDWSRSAFEISACLRQEKVEKDSEIAESEKPGDRMMVKKSRKENEKA